MLLGLHRDQSFDQTPDGLQTVSLIYEQQNADLLSRTELRPTISKIKVLKLTSSKLVGLFTIFSMIFEVKPLANWLKIPIFFSRSFCCSSLIISSSLFFGGRNTRTHSEQVLENSFDAINFSTKFKCMTIPKIFFS